MPKRNKKKFETYKHSSSKRTKIPTEQTEAYMSEEDKLSFSYKQDMSKAISGPMLRWDSEVDLEDFQIQAHPLYIHEKIHPASFVKSLVNKEVKEQEFLWDDFNGFPEGSTYEWYKHTGNWQNRIIRGDSSRVMTSLLVKESMANKVQMVYFDPPYGISFKSNFQASTFSRNTRETHKDIPSEPPVVASFRDTYKNGIHSYLDNIVKNSALARELLTDSGSYFLQIGADNVHRLSIVLDEIFGEHNHVSTISFKKTGNSPAKHLGLVCDYILWYAKDKDMLKYRQVYELLNREEILEFMGWSVTVEKSDGTTRPLEDEERHDLSRLPENSRLFRRMPLDSQEESSSGRSEDYVWNGKTYKCAPNRHWGVSHEGLDRLAELNRLDVAEEGGTLRWKNYEDEIPGRQINNMWTSSMSAKNKHYIVETAESVIERCLHMATDPGDLVLDITCGSGTTAYVAEKWGRRWITTDTSGVAVSLARQRIATAVYDYYLLQDSPEGAKKEKDLSTDTPPPPWFLGLTTTFPKVLSTKECLLSVRQH